VGRRFFRWKASQCLLAGVALGGGLALGVVGSSCDVLVQHIDTVTTPVPPGNISPDATLIRKFKDKYGIDQFVYEVLIKDPDGYFTGRVVLHRQHGAGPAAATLAAYRTGRIAGRISVTTDSVIHLKALAVVSAKSGSYCVSMSGKSDPGYPNQVFRGQFTVVGGRGSAARLYASGPLLGIQPKANYNPNNPGPLTILVATKKASLGARRGLTAACRAAAKPPPAPKVISANLDGFAFAPAGVTTLPSGTTIYPPNSTISGNVGCGSDNNLYIVVSYTGPNGAPFFVDFGTDKGTKGSPPGAKLNPGQNAVLFAAAPANDGYDYVASVLAPSGGTGNATFTGRFTLARSC
jgi:hypothetical protein